MQGKFIVFEGVEGAGKTTQLMRSHNWLRHSPLVAQLQAQGWVSEVILTREPGGTPLGQAIRHLLLHSPADSALQDRTELLLYAADRAQHVDDFLRPKLAEGALILCDRYTDSTVAYQGYGRGLNLDLIQQLNQIATGGLTSDLTLWFDVDVAEGLARTQKRGSADRMEQASLAFHQRVQQGFTHLAQANPERIVRIDATPDEAEVAHIVQTLLDQCLRQWYSIPSHP